MSPSVQDLMLQELRHIRDEVSGMRHDLEQARIDISALKVKAGLWGTLGGAIVSIGALMLALMKGILP